MSKGGIWTPLPGALGLLPHPVIKISIQNFAIHDFLLFYASASRLFPQRPVLSLSPPSLNTTLLFQGLVLCKYHGLLSCSYL